MRLFFNRVACRIAAVLLIAGFATFASGQETAPDTAATSSSGTPDKGSVEPVDKRILGILPNYRTVQDTGHVDPIPAKRKLWIASKDSFDYPIWFTAAAFAGLYQLEDSDPEFRQGLEGYLKRYAASLADQSMGNMLTEGVFPCLLHEDPRYFRRGVGPKWNRTGYALTRVFVTRTDAGTNRFNYSEWIGNSLAVAISNAYYPTNRDARDNVEKLALQVGTDSFSNLIKEFWPDIKRKLHHNREAAAVQAP